MRDSVLGPFAVVCDGQDGPRDGYEVSDVSISKPIPKGNDLGM